MVLSLLAVFTPYLRHHSKADLTVTPTRSLTAVLFYLWFTPNEALSNWRRRAPATSGKSKRIFLLALADFQVWEMKGI